MIFSKTLVGRIARGEVTMTVRPATSRRKVGARHCVQSRQGGPIACVITIVDVRECLAGEVTFRDVRAAGYRTTDNWRITWVIERDKQPTDVCEGDKPDSYYLERFDRRHAHKPVHVIAFVLAADTPRYMATAPVAGRSGDYVSSPAMSIDPTAECVDEATQERITKQALEAFGEALERERTQRKEKKKDRIRGFKWAA